jgi:hypothetical protein
VNRPPVDRRLQRQIIFAFMVVFAVLPFLLRPDATRGQVIFRVSMMVIGIVGFIVASRGPRG